MIFHEILQEVQDRGEGVRHGLPQMQAAAIHLRVRCRRTRRRTAAPQPPPSHHPVPGPPGRPQLRQVRNRQCSPKSPQPPLARPCQRLRPKRQPSRSPARSPNSNKSSRRTSNRGRNLGILSVLVALAILILIYSVYSRTVLAYAVLENIEIEQDPVAESQITVSFDVKTPGKVAFDRRSGTGHTEKLDMITMAEHRDTVWSWPSDPKTGIDFSVISRGGWFRTMTETDTSR